MANTVSNSRQEICIRYHLCWWRVVVKGFIEHTLTYIKTGWKLAPPDVNVIVDQSRAASRRQELCNCYLSQSVCCAVLLLLLHCIVISYMSGVLCCIVHCTMYRPFHFHFVHSNSQLLCAVSYGPSHTRKLQTLHMLFITDLLHKNLNLETNNLKHSDNKD